jgi:RNA-splicing ligase RtcB
MLEIVGKYGTANVMVDSLDEASLSQIYKMMNSPAFNRERVRIMPDVHCGKGSVVGFTSTLGEKVIPNVIGVDIGCGILLAPFTTNKEISFEVLDKVIRSEIPSGTSVRSSIYSGLHNNYTKIGKLFSEIEEGIRDICTNTDQDFERVLKSIGTLGGGNHYLEVDRNPNNLTALSIHSGSRNFGLQIANFHQKKAIAYRQFVDKDLLEGFEKDLAWLEGDMALAYLKDMMVAQKYALLNRAVMLDIICTKMNFELDLDNYVESIHNYIDFDNKIVRKGAISAKEGEKLVIPISMADGVILGKGKGNLDWNNSAPHGAGRLFSRNKAKELLSLDEYKSKMSNVWSSCISQGTLDESPMAYKGLDFILSSIGPSVDVIEVWKPVYNYKAG